MNCTLKFSDPIQSLLKFSLDSCCRFVESCISWQLNNLIQCFYQIHHPTQWSSIAIKIDIVLCFLISLYWAILLFTFRAFFFVIDSLPKLFFCFHSKLPLDLIIFLFRVLLRSLLMKPNSIKKLLWIHSRRSHNDDSDQFYRENCGRKKKLSLIVIESMDENEWELYC